MTDKTTSRDPDILRAQALALLDEAQSIDGLKPYFALHEHQFGETPYLVWAKDNPGEKASVLFEEDFEPDAGDSVSVYEGFELQTLVGLKDRMPEGQMGRVEATESSQTTQSRGSAPRG